MLLVTRCAVIVALWYTTNHNANGGELRLALRGASQCAGRYAVDFLGLKVRPLDGGRKATITTMARVNEDIRIDYAEVYVFSDSVAHIKLFFVPVVNVCQRVEAREPKVDFIFGSGAVPWRCNFTKGEQYPINGTLNWYREVYGSTVSYRGPIYFQMKLFTGMRADACIEGYGTIRTS